MNVELPYGDRKVSKKVTSELKIEYLVKIKKKNWLSRLCAKFEINNDLVPIFKIVIYRDNRKVFKKDVYPLYFLRYDFNYIKLIENIVREYENEACVKSSQELLMWDGKI